MRSDYLLENIFKENSMTCKSAMIKHTLESKLKSIRPRRQRMPRIHLDNQGKLILILLNGNNMIYINK